jgi:UDP-N-acetylglucosamine 3-dehydrogenase
MESSRTRLLIVGLGCQGRRHLRVAVKHPRATVVGTVDPAAASYNGVPNYGRLDEALDAVQGVDAAIVATPTIDHLYSARMLLERGVPVLVEKPLAATAEDAACLAALARTSGTLLAVGHVERFNPAVRLVHSRLREGKLGQPIALSFRRVGLPPPSSVGVDVIHDLGVHDIDVFGLLAGTTPRLEGASGSCSNGLVESAHLLLRANDVGGLVQVNWRTPARIRDFTLTTDECYIEVNYTTQVVETVCGTEARGIVDFEEFQQRYAAPLRLRLECPRAEPLIGQLGAFLAEVETSETDSLLARAEDGLRALALAGSASQAIRSRAGLTPMGS